MTRRLVHWLDTFKAWTLPRSEVQESMILWAGLFSIAAAIRRKVYFPKEAGLGVWDCYPFMYLMFVAPPGMRKTTTLGYSLELFDGLPDLVAGPQACSQAALSDALFKSPDTSLYIIAEEFSDLLLKSGNEMYEFLTSAFDGRKKFVTSTISRGIEFIENPCINLAAGTTPIWIADNMPESAIGGGYASRVIFLYENKLRRKQLFHDNLDFEELNKLKEDLQHDLRHISKEVAGRFAIDKDAKDFFEAWYQKAEPEKSQPKLQGYYQRKHVHILKLAMLFHLSYSDDLLLSLHDVKMAMKILEETIEIKLPSVFEGVGKNTYSFDMHDISRYIKEKRKVSRKEILSVFRSTATPNLLNELILGMSAMGEIKTENDEDGNTIYIST